MMTGGDGKRFAAVVERGLEAVPASLQPIAGTPRFSDRVDAVISMIEIERLLSDALTTLGWLFETHERTPYVIGINFTRPEGLLGYILVTNNSDQTGIIFLSIRYDWPTKCLLRQKVEPVFAS
jgi:hypothetical protein